MIKKRGKSQKAKSLSSSVANISNSEVTEIEIRGSEKMRYLIRRQNRYGQWVHVDTTETGPATNETWDAYLRRRFGPGKYHIAVAQEGVAGLRSLPGHESVVTVGWTHTLLGLLDHKPTGEELIQKYDVGDYLVAKLTEVTPYFLKRNGIDQDTVVDIMEQGASAFAGGYLVIKLAEIPYY